MVFHETRGKCFNSEAKGYHFGRIVNPTGPIVSCDISSWELTHPSSYTSFVSHQFVTAEVNFYHCLVITVSA